MTRQLVLAAVALSSATALAGGHGWDWDEEFTSRQWRTSSLQWAHDIHPDHPTTSDLLANYTPPAREMWCPYNGQPAPDAYDCDVHADLLDNWLVDYLELQDPSEIPSNLPAFPPECISMCNQ